MNNSIIRHYSVAALSLMILSVLTGCSDEMSDLPAMESQPETTEVALTISLGSVWDIDLNNGDASRAAPPGSGGSSAPNIDISGEPETQNVNKVRVVAFRRLDPESASSGNSAAGLVNEPFIYDATNDMELDVDVEYIDKVTDKFSDPHKHKVARGKLKKVYGYEYRVVAIAYDSQLQSTFSSINKSEVCTFTMPDGEDNWFKSNRLDGVAIDDFKAQILTCGIDNDESSWEDFISGYPSGGHFAEDADILSYNVAQIPQLFFGECYTVDNGISSEVIKYSVTDPNGNQVKDLAVTGILYRGPAKVELRITSTPKKDIFNREYAVEWICLMADNVFTEVGLSDYDDFLRPSSAIVAGTSKFTPLAYCNVADAGQQVITAYILPCKTRLAVRIKTKDNDVRNAVLTYKNVESAGNGTGIISPDVHDNMFYLRRNHKYVLTVNDSEALFN